MNDTKSMPTRGSVLRPLIAGALATLFATAALSADGNVAQEILDELAEADRARSARAEAEADWERERRGIEALTESIETARAQLRARAADTASRLTEAKKELAAIEKTAPPHLDLERTIARVIDDTSAYLNTVARELLPGIVPDAQAHAHTTPLARLQDLVVRMRGAEEAIGAWDVAILEGQRDGATLAVKVLRCGAIAAWWRSLTGSQAGTAVWKDGVLHLTNAEGAARVGIAAAFAVFEGHRVPELVVLPFGHARKRE